ncbi:hypothetical protein DAETH_25870 [Deinococcus aetherius]|uniref:DUF4127 family protein n=1 Tax=Deinococcus aetherius TaxID=200252 RepID=A0ABM8AFP5_9DEIO|nr:hypothetical protein DAETH_25870 [Deinococcus aetherius]
MIPARRVSDPLEDALARLETLREVKRQHPNLRVYAFGVIVRVAHDDDPHEEKPYYGEWGAGLRAYSDAFDRHARHGAGFMAALEDARTQVPPDVLADWTATRERNRALHLAALDLVLGDVIEHLCLTLDDTTPYGLAAFDRRLLEARVDELGLWRRVDVYPGADEVPCALIARALRDGEPRVYVHYSGALGAGAELIYEDRPAGELVRAHLRAAGCKQVDIVPGADFVLAINTPGTRQAGAQPDYRTVDTPHRHLPAFVDFVRDSLEDGRRVVVADIAYPNGAELRLWHLMQDLPLARLTGYAAWNTAGNTLGSAIAMGAVRVRDERARVEALFARMVDDALYQGRVRPEVEARLPGADPFDLGHHLPLAQALVAESMMPLMQSLWDQHFAHTGYRLEPEEPYLAWPRLFTGVFPLLLR